MYKILCCIRFCILEKVKVLCVLTVLKCQNLFLHIDFTLFFNRRLEYFTKLLRARASIDIDTVMRISQLKDFFETNTSVTIIGLISDIKETKNGHYMISIEDKSGEIKCFVNKDKKEMINKIQIEKLL